MFEEKSVPLAPKVPSSGTSPQREIFTMPSEFMVKAQQSSLPVLMIMGGVVVVSLLGIGVFLLFNFSSPPVSSLPSTPLPTTAPSVVAPQAEPIEIPVVVPTLPVVAISAPGKEDLDDDNLTNSEEEIFKTEPNNPDTDGDSYNDGDEVKNFFDPTKSEGALLKDAGLISLFTEPQLQWSIWYPTAWVVTQGLASGDAHIATALPDAFDITPTTNSERLPLDAWVRALTTPTASSGNEITPSLTTTRSGAMVLWSADNLTAYVAKPGTTSVYIIAYKNGANDAVYFPTIFRMMVESMILPS